MKKILVILLLAAAACAPPVGEPVDDMCYPVDDSCIACGDDERCFEQRVDEQLGCDVCVLFACGWPLVAEKVICSEPCPTAEAETPYM